MTRERSLTAVFCDDVRKEEGNKLSYMGVYLGVLGVQSFPTVLPRLCVVLNLRTSPDAVPSELRFRLYKDDEVVAESPVPAEILATARVHAANLTDDRVSQFGTIFQMFPVPLQGQCFFRARALCDGEELKGGSICVVEQKDMDHALRWAGGLENSPAAQKA